MAKKLRKLSRRKQLSAAKQDPEPASGPSPAAALIKDPQVKTAERPLADTEIDGHNRKATDFHTEDHRRFPGLLDYLRLRNLFQWLWSFGENYWVSRPYHSLLISLPFLLVAVAGSGFVWWLRSAPLDHLVTDYETAANAALRKNDHERGGLYLEALSALRPTNNHYRFRLALHQLTHGEQNAALRGLGHLTVQEGYLPALRWLVDQAVKPEPVLPLEDDVLQQHLQLILQRAPGDLQANRILAELYMRRGQMQAAEDHLLQVVDEVPALGLSLARVQTALVRTAEPIERHLNMAEQHFAESLLQNAVDNTARVYRAEALTMLARYRDAERVLQEGLALEGNTGDAQLRSALAVIYTELARERLSKSSLNVGSAVRLLAKALEYDPANRKIIEFVFRVAQSGGTFSSEVYENIIQTLEADTSRGPADQFRLARALDLTGATEQALEVARPLAADQPKYRPLLVRLLQNTGRHEEADELIMSMLAEFSAEPDADPAAVLESALRRAEVLSLAKRYVDSLAVLDQHPLPDDLKEATNNPATQLWNRLYGRGCLAIYDDKTNKNNFAGETEALELLGAALKTRTVAVAVIDRLAKLSYSDHPLAVPAEKRLTKILASGIANSAVYNLLGTYALQFGKAGTARKYLERALSLKKRDPMVMNNLALAHVRDEAGTPDRALELANKMLEIIPEHPDALSTRGEVLAALGRWDEARRDLELALPHRPRSRNTRLLLAKVYTKLGQPDLSAEHMRIVNSIDAETNATDEVPAPN